MSRQSRLRGKALQEDVVTRVYWAGFKGDFSNPYLEDDRRHALFETELRRYHRMEAISSDLYSAYGHAKPEPSPKEDPGPVLDEETVLANYLENRERLEWQSSIDSSYDD